MVGCGVITPSDWLVARLADAPEGLRAGLDRYLTIGRADADRQPVPDPDRLTRAALDALERAVAGPAERPGAGGVLVADALVTLALGAQAARDPAGLADFAALLRRDAAGGA